MSKKRKSSHKKKIVPTGSRVGESRKTSLSLAQGAPLETSEKTSDEITLPKENAATEKLSEEKKLKEKNSEEISSEEKTGEEKTSEAASAKVKPKSTASIVSSIVTVTIFVLLALTTLYLVFCQVTGNVPFFGNSAMLRIQTGSMESAIPTHSYIQIKKIDPSDVKVGDVITFYSKDPQILGKPNTHRVIDVSNEGGEIVFTTMGDANPRPDSYKVHQDELIGVFVKILPLMTKVGGFLTNKIVFALLIMLPATFFVYFSIKDAIDSGKKKRPVTKEDIIAAEIEKEVKRLKKSGFIPNAAKNPPENSDNPESPKEL